MSIRPATPDDAGAIADAFAASAREAYADLLAPADLREAFLTTDVSTLEAVLAEASDDEQIVYLVATTDDEVVGFVQLLWGERRPDDVESGVAFLRSLYVVPERWHEGVGSDLLARAVGRLPSSVDAVRLGVFANNDLGRTFYESRGFEQTGRGTFDIGDTDYETTVYERPVT